MSVVTKLANGIKVATLNNGVKTVQAGVFSGMGSGSEQVENVGITNLMSNCINLTSNPLVQANTDRNLTTVRSLGKNSASAIERVANSLKNSINDETVAAAKEMSYAQAMAQDDCFRGLAKNQAIQAGFCLQALAESPMGRDAVYGAAETSEVLGAVRNLNNVGMTVAAVGDVDHDEVCKQVEEQLAPIFLPNASGMRVPQYFTGGAIRYRFDTVNYGCMAAIYNAPPPGHQSAMAYEILANLVGDYDPTNPGNLHSAYTLRRRFGHKAAQGTARGNGTAHHNLAWHVEYFNCKYEVLAGNAVLFWESKTLGDGWEIHDEVNERTCDYLGNMYKRVQDFDIVRGKNSLLTGLANDLQTDPLKFVGESVANHGYIRHPTAVAKIADTVTTGLMRDALNVYFVDQEIATGGTGATEKLMDHDRMRSKTNPKAQI